MFRPRALLSLSVCFLASGPLLSLCAAQEGEPRLSASTLSGLELRSIGPAFMSGRIADVAIHPEDASTWYLAAGSGNLWKTTNAGTTWTPIFDDQGSYSIGCVTIDPNRPDTIWVGTGENVGGRHVGYGDGVYRSDDGGASWRNVGLPDSEHIGKILVDPRDSDTVWVASQGPLWSAGGQRGLYKTIDGGASWELVLSAGGYTGVNDVVMDPRDPDTLYAATHQRLRTVAALMDGGPESGIHKTTDGGASWSELEGGLPAGDMGRIGLAISPQDPDVVYAAIELPQRSGGFYRTANGGASWEKRSDVISGGTGPHYYSELWASPHEFDTVYFADVRLRVTEDGGRSFRLVGEQDKHVDNHAVAFVPHDPDYLLVGCDGGLYESYDRGRHWKFFGNLPLTQFYKVAVDDDLPFYNVYGGTQDNNSQGGPSRTDNVQGIRNSDWFVTLFGDGHQSATEPGNPDIVYAEWQQGNLMRYDRTTGEIVYIQPQPREGEGGERFNWDAPILVSPHSPTRLYFASQRVWRSDNRGDSWTPVSGDLSHARDRMRTPMMGRIWSYDSAWDLYAMSKFGTITSLAESPLVEGLLYAGTDDGRIQVSEDGGGSWRAIDALPGVPEDFFVNDIKADLFDADTVYVVVDDHKQGDFSPYVLKSTNRGRSWTSLVGDLPARHVCWRLVQDHVKPELLFLGTEFGVFFSVDAGQHWTKLQGGVPNIPFRDLAIQRRENDLVGATFGRGFYVLDDYSALRELSESALADNEALLFDTRPAHWYVQRRPLGREGRATQGADFFVADNPPFGAVFTYYLRDTHETARAARRAAEEEIAAEGGDTPSPSWAELRAEDAEEEPVVVLRVRDAAGHLVRSVEGPASAGFHRVAWDLRLPSLDPWSPDEGDGEDWPPGGGFLAAPGSYSVELCLREQGAVRSLGAPRSFEVVPLHEGGALPGASPTEVAAFLSELAQLAQGADAARASLDGGMTRAEAILSVLRRVDRENPAIEREARAIHAGLRELVLELDGDPRRETMGDPTGPVPIAQRISYADMGNRWSTYGPTPAHLESVRIARAQLDALELALDGLLRERLRALEERMDLAGLPWTPGRPLSGERH